MTLYESMVLGTAGFTAAQAVDTLQHQGLQPGTGEVLVTGATGGVGSIAIALLGKLGYPVVAATGKMGETAFLRALGAQEVVHRDELIDTTGRPMLKERWAAAIDTAGGAPLANILKAVRYGGSVAACGLVASPTLETTVYPFILRGVNLLGIDSVSVPIERRRKIWGLLATGWQLPVMEHISREVALDALDREIDRILQGRQVGRVVIAHR
jgi:putative YhdH/YhfP family quinone oxidoreductase